MNPHLTESALHDLLIGLGSDAALAHLATCSVCGEKVEAFRADMQLFNDASLAWSEARPMPAVATPARVAARQPLFTYLRWAPLNFAVGTAVLLTALGLPVWQHLHKPQPAPAMIATTGNQDTAEQIAQDNDLLRSVDAALTTTDEPTVDQYNLSQGIDRPTKHRPEARNR